MKTLVNDTTTPTPTATPDLDTFLSGYKAPLNINPDSVTAPGQTPGMPPKPAPIYSPGSNAVNQTIQYYRTGKKAGQPKPIKTYNQGPPINPGPQGQQSQGVINSELISGALFITLVDLILPVLIAFANNRFSKIKIEADKLQLTEKQRKDLEPVCDQVVRQLNLNANPMVLLTISLGGLYAMNFMLQKSVAESKTKTK